MISAFQQHWKLYLIEAWALGMFMVSACTFVIMFEHPYFHFNTLVSNPFWRRMLIAAAMGATAIALIYSEWGKKSGAHMNPAVTLANYQLDRIGLYDMLWYLLAQCTGASFFVFVFKWFAYRFISYSTVQYIITTPGKSGAVTAFFAEILLSFIMFATVLIVSNSQWAKYTGYFAGGLVFLFIWLEAPLSGMSINPARSFGSALAGNIWSSFWVYVTAPFLGMQIAAIMYRKWYLVKNGECLSMAVFMSGQKHYNAIYKVLKWYDLRNDGNLNEHKTI